MPRKATLFFCVLHSRKKWALGFSQSSAPGPTEPEPGVADKAWWLREPEGSPLRGLPRSNWPAVPGLVLDWEQDRRQKTRTAVGWAENVMVQGLDVGVSDSRAAEIRLVLSL